eukprot:gene24108-biopygen19389
MAVRKLLWGQGDVAGESRHGGCCRGPAMAVTELQGRDSKDAYSTCVEVCTHRSDGPGLGHNVEVRTLCRVGERCPRSFSRGRRGCEGKGFWGKGRGGGEGGGAIPHVA